MARDNEVQLRDEPEVEEEKEELVEEEKEELAVEEDEEELVDPLDVLKESCGKSDSCSGFASKYQQCNDRVNSRTKTEENCTEELFDYLECVNHCLQGTILSKLK